MITSVDYSKLKLERTTPPAQHLNTGGQSSSSDLLLKLLMCT